MKTYVIKSSFNLKIHEVYCEPYHIDAIYRGIIRSEYEYGCYLHWNMKDLEGDIRRNWICFEKDTNVEIHIPLRSIQQIAMKWCEWKQSELNMRNQYFKDCK